jgi:hypothetical protein
VSALLSLLQEKIITESKISSLIFLFQLDVVFPKWFVSIFTANYFITAFNLSQSNESNPEIAKFGLVGLEASPIRTITIFLLGII